MGTPPPTDTSASTLSAVVSRRVLIHAKHGVTSHDTSNHPKHHTMLRHMKTIKDKTDKLFKSMITPKSALCIRVLNHQSNLFRLLSFIYTWCMTRPFLSWLRVITQLTGRSGTGECVPALKLINPSFHQHHLKLTLIMPHQTCSSFLNRMLHSWATPKHPLYNEYNWELTFWTVWVRWLW